MSTANQIDLTGSSAKIKKNPTTPPKIEPIIGMIFAILTKTLMINASGILKQSYK